MTGSSSQFQKELTKLESLLSSLNKKNKSSKSSGPPLPPYNNAFYQNGGRRQKKSRNMFGGAADGDSRFFKLVSINGKEVDGGRYELPLKTKTGKPQTRGPKDKASSAFSEICQKNKEKGECSYKFAIQETTRGSDKKVYHYQGKRVKLSKPVVLKLKDKKTGKVKEVVKKFKNIITSLGSGHE
jgi:hypothetical protein